MIVDMDRLEDNLRLLPKMMQQWPSVAARVHVKAHKTPALAALQVKARCVDLRLINTPQKLYGELNLIIYTVIHYV